MNNLLKKAALILIVSNAVAIAPSLAMERDNSIDINIIRFERPQMMKLAQSTERLPKDEFSKSTLVRMLIDEDFILDVCGKKLTVTHGFKSVDSNSCQDVCWTIAKFYYQLQMDEKLKHVNYITNNEDFINAIDNKKKYNVMFMDNCHVSSDFQYIKSKELCEKLQKGNVDLGEIFFLKKYKCFVKLTCSTFIDGIKLILGKCLVQTIKADSSLFENPIITKYFSNYYGNSLVSQTTENEKGEVIYSPNIQNKPDLHLYLDFNKCKFFSVGLSTNISSTYSKYGFSFNLMNSGSFNISCINTKKPYDRIVYSTEQHQSKFQEEESASRRSLNLEPTGAHGVIGTVVISIFRRLGFSYK